ncbi:UDP-N-acetylmuramoyl-tripeptide--D-alanyl-D-alanine ligase MurF [Phycisphaerae bacterium RAS1]|nr:UDP-N-acetylmuramoyl-tripeptide--D-alanyl-D-alanine ligase MurF [Phycisphaerae bacterium RAS1]
MKLTLAEVVDALRGKVAGDAPPGSARGVSIDTRTIAEGDIFFALPGENVDGHQFVADAIGKGAAAVVIRRGHPIASDAANTAAGGRRPAMILVDDPLEALGVLAAYHRKLIAAQVIGVVGSNGKTTTKAMIDHILGGRFRGRCSPKSFNNAIGVPLTLLSADASDEYLVVEIGTNAPGEIAALGRLATPDMVVLTSISEEHLEGLGDLNGVAVEECSILHHLKPGAFAAVNVDCPLVRPHIAEKGLTLATFGTSPDADLRVSTWCFETPWMHFTLNGRFNYRMRVMGPHNAVNAAGAITIARRLRMEHDEIAARLESFLPPPMRGELQEIGGVMIINDAYNANPASAAAAVSVLEAYPCHGRRLLVFGEMRELGPHSHELHRGVAAKIAHARIDHVILVGPAGELMHDVLRERSLFSPRIDLAADVAACGELLATEAAAGDVVLLKASRAVGLERVLNRLKAVAPVAAAM